MWKTFQALGCLFSFTFLVNTPHQLPAQTPIAANKQVEATQRDVFRKKIEDALRATDISGADGIRRLSALIKEEEVARLRENVPRWIGELSHANIQRQEAAEKNLTEAGALAIDPVEKAVTEDDLEKSVRCLDILTEIARKTSRDIAASEAALMALERLSRRNSQIKARAAAHYSELIRTSQDRTSAAIEGAGAAVFRRSFGDVYSIECFAGSTFSDREMTLLKYLPSITSLTLSATNITDDGLAHVLHLKKLRSVSLNCSSIGDAGLTTLSAVKTLERLSLWPGNYTSTGLRSLRDLPSLRSLMLIRFTPTKENVEVLNSLNRITHLALTTRGITDDDLKLIGKLSQLSFLSVYRSPGITDAGIRHLTRLKNLRELSLSAPRVTKEAILNMKKEMPALEKVNALVR